MVDGMTSQYVINDGSSYLNVIEIIYYITEYLSDYNSNWAIARKSVFNIFLRT